MARNDIHSPKNIQPEDYVYVAIWSLKDGGPLVESERKRAEAHMASTGGSWARHGHKGTCSVCGAHAVEMVVWYHYPSKEYIKTGFDCAEKIGEGDKEMFERVRNERQAVERARAGKLKALGLLRDRGLAEKAQLLFVNKDIGEIADFPDYDVNAPDGTFWARKEQMFYTAVDIVRKLVKYGELSDKQWSFLGGLFERLEKIDQDIANFEEVQRKRKEERAKLPPAPEGRQLIKGKIVSAKFKFNDFGCSVKVTVQHDDGWSVWMTLPGSIPVGEDLNELKGKILSCKVTLKRSDDDPAFAWGSRPSNAELVED